MTHTIMGGLVLVSTVFRVGTCRTTQVNNRHTQEACPPSTQVATWSAAYSQNKIKS